MILAAIELPGLDAAEDRSPNADPLVPKSQFHFRVRFPSFELQGWDNEEPASR